MSRYLTGGLSEVSSSGFQDAKVGYGAVDVGVVADDEGGVIHGRWDLLQPGQQLGQRVTRLGKCLRAAVHHQQLEAVWDRARRPRKKPP